MNTLFMSSWEVNVLFSALCWTLLHSLWLGLLAAGLAGIIIISTKKSSAQLRYNLLGGVLILFLCSVVLAFFLEKVSSSAGQAATTVIYEVNPANFNAGVQAISMDSPTGYFDRFRLFLNEHAALIVLIWFFVFVAKNVKLLTDLVYIHRLRHRKTHASPTDWQAQVSKLGEALGIKQYVLLLQSEMVKVPVTIGMLKPVILLPLGLLANLPPDQVESILIHELAHIRRKDYFINILQTFAESIFFFNPFILWISSVLRDERESCCDDIVIGRIGHKRSYIEALIAFQEYDTAPHQYAMALGKRKSSMLDRVKRMLTSENKKLNNMEKIILLTGITLLTAFSLVPQKDPIVEDTKTIKPVQQQEATDLPVSTITTIIPKLYAAPIDTLPKTKQRDMNYKRISFPSIIVSPSDDPQRPQDQHITAVDQDGREYKVEKVNGQVTALQINGISVASSELGYYEILFQRMAESMKKAQITGTSRVEYNKLKDAESRPQVPNQKIAQLAQQPYDKQELAAKMQGNTGVPVKDKKNVQGTEFKKSYPPGQPGNKINKEGGADKKDLKTYPTDNPGNKKVPPAGSIENAQNRVMIVINALIEEKAIANFAAVEWFGLTENELVVNGVKQSEALHLKLKEQCAIKHNYGLFYGPSKLGGTGIYLDKSDIPNGKTLTY